MCVGPNKQEERNYQLHIWRHNSLPLLNLIALQASLFWLCHQNVFHNIRQKTLWAHLNYK